MKLPDERSAMKIGRFSISIKSAVLLVIQLLVVSAIAAKYLYQRCSCPRVWALAQAYDPELPMRGRYIQTQLRVDGCRNTLPAAKATHFPRDLSGAVKPGQSVMWPMPLSFRANLKVENNRLIAVQVQGHERPIAGEEVLAVPGATCDQMRLVTPTNYYISDTVKSPLPFKPGQELWVEVTVPAKGPPRPLAMALKDNGVWKPLGTE
jgi:hypothetical protein